MYMIKIEILFIVVIIMSNIVYLRATQFIDCEGNTYGYRLFDDYGITYCNTFEVGEYNKICNDDIYLLISAIGKINNGDLDDIDFGIFNHMREVQCGLYINRTYYEYKEIKEYLNI